MKAKRVRRILSGRISVFIDSGGSSAARRVTLSKGLLGFLTVIGLIVVSGLSVFSLDTLIFRGQLNRLKRENKRLLQKFDELGKSADSLTLLLAYVERHDIELRVQSGMDVLPSDLRELGVGGSAVEDPEVAKLRQMGSGHCEDVSRVAQEIDKLVRKADYQKESFAEVDEKLSSNRTMWDHIPSVVPTTGCYSGRFGMRNDPILGIRKMHCGVDITTDIGTPVRATADGVVCYAGWLDGYGNVVKIDHGYEIQTVYAHLSRILVNEGERVTRYRLVAVTGNTGRTVGPHLHYEVRVAGKSVNPEGYFLDGEEILTQYPMP